MFCNLLRTLPFKLCLNHLSIVKCVLQLNLFWMQTAAFSGKSDEPACCWRFNRTAVQPKVSRRLYRVTFGPPNGSLISAVHVSVHVLDCARVERINRSLCGGSIKTVGMFFEPGVLFVDRINRVENRLHRLSDEPISSWRL